MLVRSAGVVAVHGKPLWHFGFGNDDLMIKPELTRRNRGPDQLLDGGGTLCAGLTQKKRTHVLHVVSRRPPGECAQKKLISDLLGIIFGKFQEAVGQISG